MWLWKRCEGTGLRKGSRRATANAAIMNTFMGTVLVKHAGHSKPEKERETEASLSVRRLAHSSEVAHHDTLGMSMSFKKQCWPRSIRLSTCSLSFK